MAQDDRAPNMRISIGNGGWVRVDSEDLPGPLYLRLAQDEAGHWSTRDVYLEGEARHIEAADLRNIPIRALETEILANGGVAVLSARVNSPGPDLATLSSYYATSFGRRAEHWVADSFRAQLPGGDGPPRDLGTPITHKPVAPLTAPTEGLTDEFLIRVAAAYRTAVSSRKHPAPVLADQAGVPARTVHRWVYIARQRGLLPPAGRRRASSPSSETDTRPAIATAVVTSDLGVLVCRRNDGKPPWTFIGGQIQGEERPGEAASREVKEETGLEVKSGRIIGRRIHPATGRTMIYISAKPTQGTDVYVGDEAELAEVRWVSLAEAEELLAGMYEPVHRHLVREIGAS